VLFQLRDLRSEQLRVRAVGNVGKAVAEMSQGGRVIGLSSQDYGEQLFAVADVVERIHG